MSEKRRTGFKTIDGIDIFAPICDAYRKPIADHCMELLRHRKNIWSQKGEDGIMNKLIAMNFPFTNNLFCEFGAWDGKQYSNTWNLVKNHDWHGIMIESNETKYQELVKNAEEVPGKLMTKNYSVGYVKKNGDRIDRPLDDILAECGAPLDIDVISMDTDGPDYYIWEGLVKYKPKMIIIEHNSLNAYVCYKYGQNPRRDPDGLTSYWSMRELCENKGYVILVDTGNLICADKDVFETFRLRNLQKGERDV